MDRDESSRVHHEFEKFYAKHPELEKIIANHEMFLARAEEEGGSEVLDHKWLEQQLNDPEFSKTLAFNTNYISEAQHQQRQVQAQESRAAAINLLVKDYSRDEKLQETYRQKLEFFPAEEVQNKVTEVRERKRLRGLTPDEIRKELSDGREQPEPMHLERNFDVRTIQQIRKAGLADEVLDASISRESLLMLADNDPKEFKKLCQRKGYGSVNNRLNGVN